MSALSSYSAPVISIKTREVDFEMINNTNGIIYTHTLYECNRLSEKFIIDFFSN